MPFVANMQDDTEDKKNQPQGSQGVVSPSGVGGGAVRLAPSTAVEAGGPGASGTGPASSGGQFASMNQYLKANMSQAEPLAGKLTAGIGKEYQGLEGQNQQALSTIGNQVSAQPDYSKASETIAQETADPVSFASDKGNVSSFQNLLKASYSGPTSAEGTNEYANQQAAINKSIAQGQQAVQTNAGRENLLSQNEAKPTTGVTALNSAILSKSPTALASVANAYKPFQNLLTGLQGGATEQNKAIAERQSQATTAQKASNQALTSQMSGLNTDIGNRLSTAQQKLGAQNAQIKAELAAGTPSNTTLQALGMTPEQWSSLSAAQKAAATPQDVFSNQRQFGATTATANIDPADFLTQIDPNVALNAGNVATPEDYTKAQAFQSLMGNLNLPAPAMAINPATSAQASTAPTSTNTYDYKTALSTAQQTKAAETAAAQAYVDALQGGADEAHAQAAASNAAKNANIAGTAGSVIGAGVGTYFGGPVGGAVGATVGNYAGRDALSTNQKYISELKNPTSKSSLPDLVTGGAVTGVKTTVNTIKNIFCFHPDTLVTMDNGSQLPICQIGVGDITKGGKVLAITRAVGQDFYWYNGVIVTGKHAVKEAERWVRVENARIGHRIPLLTEIVCNLVTEKHRIYANGIEFADQYETNDHENLDLNESLEALNNDITLG